jgi:hypothetical protein
MPALPPGSASREGETDLGPTWDICKPSKNTYGGVACELTTTTNFRANFCK